MSVRPRVLKIKPASEAATSLTRTNTSCSTATGGQSVGLVAPLSSLQELADPALISVSGDMINNVAPGIDNRAAAICRSHSA